MTMQDPPMPQIVTQHLLIPAQNMFLDAQPGSALVLHKTAGWQGASAADIANMFIHAPDGRSAHFVVGVDDQVVQCVPLQHGAGANCCVEPGHDPFWDPLASQFGNLNTCTISIEHVDYALDNSSPLTAAQKRASFRLIQWIVTHYGFDTTPVNGQMQEIRGHNSLDPQSRARCPGNFPWPELIQFLHGVPMEDFQLEAATDEWNSTTTGALFTTGIAAWWLSEYRRGVFHGPPLAKEKPLKDWQGNPIVVQRFAGGRCEWVNGNAHWYDYT
jgi:N-acetyl-anhydromuramyl-L-alanine amidase AmpD